MKTTTKLSTAAQAYITSLMEQNKIFTAKTISKHFPSESMTDISAYLSSLTSKTYIKVSESMVLVPKTMFAKNASTINKVSVTARNSTVSGKKVMHVSLTPSMVEDLKLSCRKYCYSISKNVITVHSSSTSTKHPMFNIWATNKGVIPVPAMGIYTIIVK